MSSDWKDFISKIKVPPNIHVFLWLTVHNKSLTRDNLAKRRHVEDVSCVFCDELESIQHLFFDCIVAQHMWAVVVESVNIHVPSSLHSLLSFWKLKNDVMPLIWLLLLPCGSYGYFKTNLSSRSEAGKVCNAVWTWWAPEFGNGRYMFRQPRCAPPLLLKAARPSTRGAARIAGTTGDVG